MTYFVSFLLLISFFQIFDDHYHFTHRGVVKRSLAPNSEKKVSLAVDTRIKWSKQQVAKRRAKRDLKVQDSDPKWPSMWYLVSFLSLISYVSPIFLYAF